MNGSVYPNDLQFCFLQEHPPLISMGVACDVVSAKVQQLHGGFLVGGNDEARFFVTFHSVMCNDSTAVVV
jgi:hypothetical protein